VPSEVLRKAQLGREIAREQTLSGTATRRSTPLRLAQRPERFFDPWSGREVIDWSRVGEGDVAPG
jgi:hypothetical protein